MAGPHRTARQLGVRLNRVLNRPFYKLILHRNDNELFHLFRRFHPTADEGTGVGLSLVNRIVQARDGRIDVESQEGTGTTFRGGLQSGGKCSPN